jgi:hypothetical protein
VTSGKKIEAAFAFTMIDGLVVDVGVKAPISVHVEDDHGATKTWNAFYNKEDYWANDYWQVSVGGKFGKDKLSVLARVDAKFGKQVKIRSEAATYNSADGSYNGFALTTTRTYAPVVNTHINPEFDLGFAKVGADLGFTVTGSDTWSSQGENIGVYNYAGYGIKDYADEKLTKGYTTFGAGAYVKKTVGKGFITTGLFSNFDYIMDGGIASPSTRTTSGPWSPVVVTRNGEVWSGFKIYIPVIMEVAF